MSSFSTIGKFLDQPLLVSKFSQAVPGVLTTGTIIYGINNIHQVPKNEKKKAFVKNLCVLSFTVFSALVATRGMRPVTLCNKQILKGFNGLLDIKSVNNVKQHQSNLIDAFTKENQINDIVLSVLNNAKGNILKLDQIQLLQENLGKTQSGDKFLKELISDPENISSKEIFKEIGRLSLIGLIPVIGGITGGVLGDRLTENNWKNKIPDKIKEGSYQYLANIFLCNIGAGAALGIMEKMNIKSKTQRAVGMIVGIILTGLIGGSAIANYIGKKFINPLFRDNSNKHTGANIKDLYSERKPEAIDIGMHVDDIATVAVISGLKWIEPALPVMYSISGYKAGIGYRNGYNS